MALDVEVLTELAVAHDLRTPLNFIKMGADIWSESSIDSGKPIRQTGVARVWGSRSLRRCTPGA